LIDPTADRFNPKVPLPLPVDTVTAYDVPDPVTPVTSGVPPSPPPATVAKSAATTPVTGSENTTFHETDAAFDGELPARVNDDTVGGVVSTVHEYDVADDVPEVNTACTLNVCEIEVNPE
jgi:hypothetical protein